jgi:hypothetical protein
MFSLNIGESGDNGTKNIIINVCLKSDLYNEIIGLTGEEKSLIVEIGLNAFLSIKHNSMIGLNEDEKTTLKNEITEMVSLKYKDELKNYKIVNECLSMEWKNRFEKQQEELKLLNTEMMEVRLNSLKEINDYKTNYEYEINNRIQKIKEEESIKMSGEQMEKTLFYKNEINNFTNQLKKEREYIEKLQALRENDKDTEKIRIQEEVAKQTENYNNYIEIIKKTLTDKETELETLKTIRDTQLAKEKEMVEKELQQRMALYDTIVINLKEQLNNQITESALLKTEIKGLRENQDKTYNDTQKLIEELNYTIEKKSSKNIGIDGENFLIDLLWKTFKFYPDFNLTNTSTKGHQGDIHLTFSNFNVIIDCKKYSNTVTTINVKKFKSDMYNNTKNINIGWLLSLDTATANHIKHDFMVDELDLQSGFCICYVNHLMSQANPEEFLKQIWYNCSILHEHILKNKKDDEIKMISFEKYKEKVKTSAVKMEEITKNNVLLVRQLDENLKNSLTLVKEILTTDINNIRDNEFNFVKSWFYNVVAVVEGKMVKTDQLYGKFKEQNMEQNIPYDNFRIILESFIDEKWIKRQKTAGSPWKLMNFEFL